MSDVKRYAVGLNGTAFMGMMERHSPFDKAHYVYGPEFGPMADYVRASDYDALQADFAALFAKDGAEFACLQARIDALAAENAYLTRLIAAYVNAVETGLDAHAASSYLEMRLIRNDHDRPALQPSSAPEG